MSTTDEQLDQRRPTHGQIGYLQLPAADVGRSAAFYQSVFGWQVELRYASFEAPGLNGQWTTDRAPAPSTGPLIWLCADQLWPTLSRVTANGGAVRTRPQLDQDERWLTEVDDPAGNRIGIVVPLRAPQPQTMIAVRDVEAASRWYQELLGLRSDHGGPAYERLLSGGSLALQLHQQDVEHHHGPIGGPGQPSGSGVLLWFGEVADFDDAVLRAERLGAPVVRPVHRNPPSDQGNGPSHRELWVKDLDGYTVVLASPDGEAYELD